jgi:hypothetical protein
MSVQSERRPWSWWHVALWGTALIVVGAWQGPRWARGLRPPPDRIVDFFQEWASARFWRDGLPVYTPQEEGLRRYLGQERDPGGAFNEVNAHPPTSVLLALPLAWFDYQDACLVWNLLSLAALAAAAALVVRGLGLSLPPRAVLPGLTVLLVCYPLRRQNEFVQLNGVLVLLVAGAWAAGRAGRLGWAGALAGVAAVVKLFPALLFLYFLPRRRWRALAAGAATVVVATALTAAVLGPDSYRDYVRDVLPRLETYRGAWPNASLPGLWHKLFVGGRTFGHTDPLWHSPAAARLAGGTSCLAVAALVAAAALRARGRAGRDHAFGLSVTAMLLASPITWDHYFLLLLLPAALLGATLPRPRPRWYAFLACLAVLWLPPELYHLVAGLRSSGLAQPWQTVTTLALQTYALLGLFVLGLVSARGGPAEGRRPAAEAAGRPSIARRPEGVLVGVAADTEPLPG